MADVDPVYDIIEQVYDLRDDSRNRELCQKPGMLPEAISIFAPLFLGFPPEAERVFVSSCISFFIFCVPFAIS